MSKTSSIMGYNVYTGQLNNIYINNTKKIIINTINPHSYVVAKSNSTFNKALSSSDILLPDGSGIVLASRYVNKEKIQKISGFNMHTHLLESLNKKSGKCFYMGASENTLKLIQERIRREYPNIQVESYSPPYKEEFTQQENEEIFSKINSFNPDILFIGLTAPKQEIWLNEHKDKINFSVAVSIGAVFDFFAGTIKRSPQFFIDIHLEWLPRLLQEPKRLGRRNFISTPLFLMDMFYSKLASIQLFKRKKEKITKLQNV